MKSPTSAMIMALQQKHGLSAGDAAELLQVSLSAYNHWLYATKYPNGKTRTMPANVWHLFNLLLKETS